MIRTAAGSPGARRPPAAALALPERAVQLMHEARWMLSLALALFLLLILFTYDRADPGWSHAVAGRVVQNAGGRVGAWVADLLLYLFGLSAYLLVALLGRCFQHAKDHVAQAPAFARVAVGDSSSRCK